MKVGSLVKCIKESKWKNIEEFNAIGGVIPKVDGIYTVRKFWKSPHGNDGIYLEEIVNKNLISFEVEPSFTITDFVKLLTDEENECIKNQIEESIPKECYEL